MYYDIQLPRSIQGTKLLEALQETASRLGWRYEQIVESYSVSQGSINVEPQQFKVRFRTRRFFGDSARTGDIKPNQSYHELTVWPGVIFGRESVEKFTAALYEVLQQ